MKYKKERHKQTNKQTDKRKVCEQTGVLHAQSLERESIFARGFTLFNRSRIFLL